MLEEQGALGKTYAICPHSQHERSYMKRIDLVGARHAGEGVVGGLLLRSTGARWIEPGSGGSANLASSLKINPQRSGVVMTLVVGGFGAGKSRSVLCGWLVAPGLD
jgi:hypothetical protein